MVSKVRTAPHDRQARVLTSTTAKAISRIVKQSCPLHSCSGRRPDTRSPRRTSSVVCGLTKCACDTLACAGNTSFGAQLQRPLRSDYG
jgi:hypothetical protein